MAAPLIPSGFPGDYEEARLAVAQGRIHDALVTCASLLADPALPHYYRINTLVLLASVSTDWSGKENLRLNAERIWKESRDLFPEGDDAATDSALDDMRLRLDRLKAERGKVVPENYEDALSAGLADTRIENLVESAEGRVEAMADGEYDNATGDAVTPSTQAEDDTTWTLPSRRDEGYQDQDGHSGSPIFTPALTFPASLGLLGNQVVGYGPPVPVRTSRDGQTAGTRMVHRRHGPTRRFA